MGGGGFNEQTASGARPNRQYNSKSLRKAATERKVPRNGTNRTNYAEERQDVPNKGQRITSKRNMNKFSIIKQRGRSKMDTDEIDAMNDMEYDEERQDVPERSQRKGNERNIHRVPSDRSMNRSSSAKRRGQSVRPRMDNDTDSDEYRQDVPDRSQRKAGDRNFNRTPSDRQIKRVPSDRQLNRVPSDRQLNRGPSDRSMNRSSSAKRRGQYSRPRMDSNDMDTMNDTDYDEERQDVPERSQRNAGEIIVHRVPSDRSLKRFSSAKRRGQPNRSISGMDNDEEKIQHSVNKRGINRPSTPNRRAQSGQSRMGADAIDVMHDMDREDRVQYSGNRRTMKRSSSAKRKDQSGQSRMDTDFIETMEDMENDEERHSEESETTPMDDVHKRQIHQSDPDQSDNNNPFAVIEGLLSSESNLSDRLARRRMFASTEWSVSTREFLLSDKGSSICDNSIEQVPLPRGRGEEKQRKNVRDYFAPEQYWSPAHIKLPAKKTPKKVNQDVEPSNDNQETTEAQHVKFPRLRKNASSCSYWTNDHSIDSTYSTREGIFCGVFRDCCD